MKQSTYWHLKILFICAASSLTVQNPIYPVKSFSGDNTKCLDSEKTERENDGSNFDKLSNAEFIINENLLNKLQQKRQVGVIYDMDQPIGILQPYQRAYRFIPIKGDSEELYYEQSSTTPVLKREVSALEHDRNYPSILANFKISTKLEKKRNYDSSADETEELQQPIRRMRSSNSKKKIEEELKNVLDDMGLMENSGMHDEKREAEEEEREEDEDEEESQEPIREKRQKPETSNENQPQLVENLKESGDLMISGNKSPLASAVEVTKESEGSKGGECENKQWQEHANEEFEKRVERQIQDKINALKEEVKREINELEEEQNEEGEDNQRKKRQASDNLLNEENSDVDPVLHPGEALPALTRKRRNVKGEKDDKNIFGVKNLQPEKRAANPFVNYMKQKKLHSPVIREVEGDGGDLLGGDDLKGRKVSKRQTEVDQKFKNMKKDLRRFLKERIKRSEDFLRMKRQSRSRFRRRIIDHPNNNRPQQLNEMSDIDLFGALPQSYDGELSRYKRI